MWESKEFHKIAPLVCRRGIVFISVQTVEYLGDYRLRLTFNSGEGGVADLADLVQSRASAAPLRDPEEFRRVFLDAWPTLVWPCGFDLAPEHV
ncbi:MAG: DUF2442 domain-containing protein [Magnetococcales bacterium]|nr:DUF2442 domain-containing protein [Magnetococcales bacterium]